MEVESMSTFKALVVDKNDQGEVTKEVRTLEENDLPEGDVTIDVHYSSINFKDGMAAAPGSQIAQGYPLIPGIDLAGVVASSSDSRYREGDEVLVTGYELGVAHHGGYAEKARVPADWVVKLPEGMTPREAMIFGTAGFTAGLSVVRLEEEGVTPEQGEVVVTGATGGVGSMAVAMLHSLGYDVAAVTGNSEAHDYLRNIGAGRILSREDVNPDKRKPLGKAMWAGAVDPVGGETLAYLLSTMKYHGTAAVSGLTGGTDVPTTVHPFILRGVNLAGIDSVYCPVEKRQYVWNRLADDLKIQSLLDTIASETTLDDLAEDLDAILENRIQGRRIVALK